MKHETPIDLWLYEKEAFADGFQLVCGVDEAGRGPLAGPVCAAAVILPPELVIPGLNDSKKLTDKKRRELCSVITAEAVSYGIAFASEQEIDEINILQATFLAMERAMAQLAPPPELALIDGNRSKDFGLPVRTIVKGDSLSASIAAAREFVDSRKQQRLRATALLYLSQHESELQPRFDVIEIYAPAGTQTRRPQITHMEDAF